MSFRRTAVSLLTIAALAPVIANASPDKASAKACATAFASSIASPGSPAPTYKLDYRNGQSTALSEFFQNRFTFTLEAHDPKTGVAIARASCSADYRGTVTSIEALPLNGHPAALAASF